MLVYLLTETFAEKVRSIFERTRLKDLYAMWFFSRMVG